MIQPISQRIHCLFASSAPLGSWIYSKKRSEGSWCQYHSACWFLENIPRPKESMMLQMKLADLVRKSSCNWRPFFAWRNWTERKSLFWRVDFAQNLMCGFDQRHFFAMVSTRVLGILVAGTTTCPGRESQDPCEYRSSLSCEENFSRINCCNVVLQSTNSTKNCDLEIALLATIFWSLIETFMVLIFPM